MKKVLLIAITCVTMAGTTYASTFEEKKDKKQSSKTTTDENAPIACTGTLNIYRGGTYVNVKVVLNNDITSEKDCETWVNGQADKLGEELGSGYSVKASYSFVAP